MMRWTTVVWFLVGFAAGVAHILLLWRASQRPGRGGTAALLRLLSVAALLVVAALMGHLLPAASGWGSGFILAVIGTSVWKATCTASKSSATTCCSRSDSSRLPKRW